MSTLSITQLGYVSVFFCFFLYGCQQPENPNKQTQIVEVVTEKAKKPNVVAIIIDDAGYVDFGFMGSPDLKTPNIDNLAAAGVVFTDAHVTSTVCAPSRAGIMSGMYQQRFGFEMNGTGGDLGLDLNVDTIADAMRSAGYTTMALGKWHLGHTSDYHPNKRGFDEFYGFLSGARSYFPLETPTTKNMLQDNGERIQFEGYMTDVLGDQAVKLIDENKDKPFFMFFAPNAVHSPMHAKKEDLDKFAGHPRQVLAAMTWSLDENIGKIIQKLKDEDLYDNTIIYFMSDNGGAFYNMADNGPLKGWKGNKFEGGHRVPFTLTWPAKIAPGQTYKRLVSSLDLFPTSIKAAGADDSFFKALDGVDLLPYILKQTDRPAHEKLFWRKGDFAAARHNQHKLVRINNKQANLYNLNTDLGEMENLNAQQPLIYSQLNADLKLWEQSLISPLWTEEEEWERVTQHIHESLFNNQPVMYKSPEQYTRYIRRLENSTNGN